jgi:hypothetical protein
MDKKFGGVVEEMKAVMDIRECQTGDARAIKNILYPCALAIGTAEEHLCFHDTKLPLYFPAVKILYRMLFIISPPKSSDSGSGIIMTDFS